MRNYKIGGCVSECVGECVGGNMCLKLYASTRPAAIGLLQLV